MKRSMGVLLGILMALVFASSANAEILINQTSATGRDLFYNSGYSARALAQGFIFDSTKVLDKVSFKLARVGSPTGNMIFRLREGLNGVPVGPDLVTLSSDVATLPNVPFDTCGSSELNQYEVRVFDFSNLNIVANQEYFLILDIKGTNSNSSNILCLAGNFTANPYGPKKAASEDSYGAWYVNGHDNLDYYFIVEGTPFSLRLPYTAGESWKVTQGNYTDPANTPENPNPTHTQGSGMDYAWDFSKPIGAGEDCNNDLGAPALAPASGTVSFADTSGDWGKTVVINYGNGLYGRLAHLDSISVSVGQSVLQGQQVGTVGNTGNAGGCAHVHYQTQGANSVSVNPIGNATFIDPNVLAQNPDGVPTENNNYTSSNTSP